MSAALGHLLAIAAAPRPAGGAAERSARDYCAGVLRDAGFTVSEHPFEYSAFPGRWGTPLAGVAAAAMFVAAGYEGTRDHALAALLILALGALFLSGLAFWLSRWGVLDAPWARARSVNLSATRGVPTLWLVAHLDSKSQPVPIGVRAASIIACLVLLAVAALLAMAQLDGTHVAWGWTPLTMLGVLVSIPVIATTVGARSPGALDDASGVVTVLRAAEQLPRDLALGVLLTSAEELGLAGARAWAREAPPSRAINIDGVDDGGGLRLIFSRRYPLALMDSLSLARGAWPAPRRLPTGLLMDGIALAEAGWEVLNVSKGSLSTVSRIHTPHDNLDRLEGRGAEEVATMLVAAIVSDPSPR